MKKLIFLVMFLFLNIAFSNEKIESKSLNESPNKDYEIYTIEEVVKNNYFYESEDFSDYDFFEDWDENKIIHFQKGSSYPLHLFLDGDFFDLDVDANHLPKVTLKKDFYMKIQDYDFYFSENLKDWNDAFDFFTGDLNFRFANLDENSLKIEIETTIDREDK
jgi:hypothetical protein